MKLICKLSDSKIDQTFFMDFCIDVSFSPTTHRLVKGSENSAVGYLIKKVNEIVFQKLWNTTNRIVEIRFLGGSVQWYTRLAADR